MVDRSFFFKCANLFRAVHLFMGFFTEFFRMLTKESKSRKTITNRERTETQESQGKSDKLT
jgi:hypothetical protein